MSKTRVQIQFKVLAILTGGDVGTSPSDEDATNIDGYIDSTVAKLMRKKVVYISDPDSLDDEIFEPFCELVANDAAHEYGGKTDPNATRYYENEIRSIMAETPGYGPQIVEFF